MVPRPVWIEPEPLPADCLTLHDDPLLSELLYRRHIRDRGAAAEFLATDRRPAPEPSRLPAMDQAVERICQAIDGGERIAIFGDYDADGVTSTALLARALRAACGSAARVITRLPRRAAGYGLNPAAIDDIAGEGATLLVAVDCASTDHQNVAYARERGLDVVILDHHQMTDAGPEGALTVSAHLSADGRYRELAAVGIAYLLVVALARHGCRIDGDDGEPETHLLDYVALGTIGDVAPLTEANRPLVRDGLRLLRERPRAGVRAVCRRAGIEPATLTAEQVAFKLVPRLNAAGRMGDPDLALRLLLADELGEAVRLAGELEELNRLRRAESRRIVAEAEALIQGRPGWDARRLWVISGQGWTSGVLGIAAAQLTERHGRPVIVLNDDGTISRGSARSVPGFDITGALAGCGHLLHEHGGHSQAAGLTVPTAQVAELEARLASEIEARDIEVPIAPAVRLDADLPIERLVLDTARLLALMEPFGAANEQPVLRIRGARVVKYATIGADRSHLKIHLSTPHGTVQALFWGAAERSRELVLQPCIDLAATVGIDHWNGRSRLHVEVKDFRVAE